MWRTIANGDVWEGEICNLTKTQDEYWVKTTIVPVLDKTGKPIKYVSIRTDISEQKNLETKLTNLTIELNRRVAERTEKYKKAQVDAEMSLHSIEALLSSVDQGIVEMDNDIRLVRWNSRYEELLEIPSGFLQVGKEGLDILRFLAYRGDYGPGNPEELARARFESLTRIDEVPRTVTFRKKLHVDVRVHRTPTGGWVESFTDVTEAKKSEIALSEARNAAEASNVAKSQFLANMSHELRTPMNGVVGMAEILALADIGRDKQHMVQTILNSSKSLLSIIDDILDLSKVEAGKLTIEKTDVHLLDVIENVAKMLAPKADGLNVRVHLLIDPSLPKIVRTDPTRFRQILSNLAENAVKFARRNSPEKRGQVQIIAGSPKSGFVQLRVLDNGIGMNNQTLDRLFKPFVQADETSTRKYGGTGLGLSIVHNLVELMGGTIQVQSTEGAGSEFTVLLPIDIVSSFETAHPLQDVSGAANFGLFDSELNKNVVKLNQRLNTSWKMKIASDVDHLIDLVTGAQKRMVFVTLAAGTMAENLRIRDQVTKVRRDTLFLCQTYDRLDPLGLVEENFYVVSRFPTLPSEVLRGISVLLGNKASSVKQLSGELRSAKNLSNAGNGKPFRILLVEDNETNQDVISTQLKMLGCEVEVAENGVRGLEMWHPGAFDLLLADCHMPEMDGFEMTQKIRQAERSKNLFPTPIIAVTANALKGEAEKCLEVGMDDYLSKPVALANLKTTLEKWVSTRHE